MANGASSTSLFNIISGHVTLLSITFTNFTGGETVICKSNT